MTKRLTAGLAAVALGGCSFLFQEHLSDHHDPHNEPVCDTGGGWALLDGLFAVAAIVEIVSAGSLSGDQKDEAMIGGVIDLAVFGTSGIAGSSWSGQCEDAVAKWKQYQVEAARDAAVDEEAKRDAKERAARHSKQAEVSAQPRGFYCATSAATEAAGICTREKLDCQRIRTSAVAAVADLTECALVETAQCYQWAGNYWCAPSVGACEAQRARDAADAQPCTEEK